MGGAGASGLPRGVQTAVVGVEDAGADDLKDWALDTTSYFTNEIVQGAGVNTRCWFKLVYNALLSGDSVHVCGDFTVEAATSRFLLTGHRQAG